MKEVQAEATVLYGPLFSKLVTNGITVLEYNALKAFPMGHGSVEGFVHLNIAAGNLEWEAGKLRNTNRRLGLDLDQKLSERLTLKAQISGLTEAEYVSRLVASHLEKMG